MAGSGTGTLSLTGTANDLRTLLNTANAVRLNATASNTVPYTLSASVQSLTAGVVRLATTAQASLLAVGEIGRAHV